MYWTCVDALAFVRAVIEVYDWRHHSTCEAKKLGRR